MVLRNESSLGNASILLYKVIMNRSVLATGANASNNSMNFYGSNQSTMPLSSLYIAWLCISVIIFIPGVIANSMILAVVYKIEKLRIASNYLIGSLAVADLLMMTVMAGFVFSDVFLLDISANVNTFLWPSFDLFVGSASIISLAGVSFDRAIAVFNPLQYHETSHVNQAISIVKWTWFYSILTFILSMLRCVVKSKAYRFAVLYISYGLSFLLPFSVIVISYTLILSATIKNVKLSRSVEKAIVSAAFRLSDNASPKCSRVCRLRIQEIKIAGSFVIILVPFVACWGFFFGTHFYEDITENYSRSDLHEWFLITLPWVSSSINPLIYIISISSLRNGCKKLLCKSRYLARARESIATTLLSKRSSAIDGRLTHNHIERTSFLSKCGLPRAFTRTAKSNTEMERGCSERVDNLMSSPRDITLEHSNTQVHLVVKSPSSLNHTFNGPEVVSSTV